MKDIVISARVVRRELYCYLASFGLSVILNVIAIVRFDRPWVELIPQIGYVVVISILIYIILWIPRLIITGIRRLK